MPIYIISFTYWGANIVCGLLTVFVFGRCDTAETPMDERDQLGLCMTGVPAYYGVILFWLVVVIGMMASFLVMKKKDFGHWYSHVFLYGAY